MLEKVKEFQVYASAVVVLIGGAFYVFQLVTSVAATAKEYKQLQSELGEFKRSYAQDQRAVQQRQHVIDLKINTIETILRRIDRRVAPNFRGNTNSLSNPGR